MQGHDAAFTTRPDLFMASLTTPIQALLVTLSIGMLSACAPLQANGGGTAAQALATSPTLISSNDSAGVGGKLFHREANEQTGMPITRL
jgi:hypothetical protein